MSKIAIIGSGFSGISASAYLSNAGHEVHVFEKNEAAGGRARQFKTAEGYVFDMGPSWYWMPDIFENFFNDFGHSTYDFYQLRQLDPAFEIVFAKSEKMKIPANFSELCSLFESIEKGSSVQLEKFMQEAQYKYETGMGNMVKMPGLSLLELANPKLLNGAMRLQLFSSFSKHIRKYFSHPKLIALMEFPVLFLGASPQNTPALYSLMNYAGLKLGTWYPEGGFGKVVEGMVKLSKNEGTTFHYHSAVDKIMVQDQHVKSISVNGEEIGVDGVIAAADYHFVESKLLDKKFRNYNNTYWASKTFAPSCLIYYIGLNKKIKSIQHHTLFFEEDLLQHSKAIYKNPEWPDKPLFYVCCPSQTDEKTAPLGHENLFILMPIATGLEDSNILREEYFKIMIHRLERHLGENIIPFIDFKKSYCIDDFKSDYHSYNGNAYGLANTLRQTAVLKPKIKNKKVKNLFYAGQLTVPGPGVPPALISGKIAAELLLKQLKPREHEIPV